MKKMKSDSIVILINLILGLIVLFFIIPNEAVYNKVPALSSAFYPKILTYLLIFLSGLLFFQTFKLNLQGNSNNNIIGIIGVKKIILINIVSFIFLFLLANLGYSISTPIYLFSILYILGEKRIIISIVYSILMTIVLYIIFYNLMGIKLP